MKCIRQKVKTAKEEKRVLMKSQNDKLNEYREEMNEMLIDKLSKVRNNIIHEKYFVVSVEADDIVAAKASFSGEYLREGLPRPGLGEDVAVSPDRIDIKRCNRPNCSYI